MSSNVCTEWTDISSARPILFNMLEDEINATRWQQQIKNDPVSLLEQNEDSQGKSIWMYITTIRQKPGDMSYASNKKDELDNQQYTSLQDFLFILRNAITSSMKKVRIQNWHFSQKKKTVSISLLLLVMGERSKKTCNKDI